MYIYCIYIYIYGVHMCHNLNASGSSLCAGYVALRVAFGAEARRGREDLDPKKSAFSHDSHRQSISKPYEIHINSEKRQQIIMRLSPVDHKKMVVRTGLMASNELETQVSERHN